MSWTGMDTGLGARTHNPAHAILCYPETGEAGEAQGDLNPEIRERERRGEESGARVSS